MYLISSNTPTPYTLSTHPLPHPRTNPLHIPYQPTHSRTLELTLSYTLSTHPLMHPINPPSLASYQPTLSYTLSTHLINPPSLASYQPTLSYTLSTHLINPPSLTPYQPTHSCILSTHPLPLPLPHPLPHSTMAQQPRDPIDLQITSPCRFSCISLRWLRKWMHR